ncbi:regulatory protein MarR [Methyloglobulus morosus KoM1]|uniref:Regulatory protein MarR n=1 Tax=Methyloglobulus morosus KoM1 TaxID=1116472 RepID=V5BZI5_9GAMM|nr:MarR family winged helix-turn-helix transcriptional regulator [Methyloglobulus morosus]ESS69958.1 regulatory protein MarR [Methyloglobulus morosus KoM1]
MEKTSVFDIIERMAALIRSEERKKCTEFGLQVVHLQVLDYLSRCNKYSDTPAALSNYLGMTRGTVSQTLLLLEKKGYVNKTTDTADRRVIHLSLLPEGRAMLEQARPCELFIQASELLDRGTARDYDETMVTVLTALQKSNKSHTFGLCKTCQYFTLMPEGYLCGLTKENLTEEDSGKICQEHTVS